MKWQHLVLVFGVTLAVRLLLYSIPDRSVVEMTDEVDCRDYVQLGKNLALHGTLTRSETAPFVRAVDRTPLYPLLIAAAIKVAPTEEAAIELVVLLQQILGALTATLAAFAAYLILQKQSWAMVAGFLVGLEPYSIRLSLMTWTETLFIFLLVSSVLLLLLHFQSRQPMNGFLVGAGICFGLTALCRPVGQQIALFAVPISLLLDQRFPFQTKFVKIVLPFAACYVMVIALWVLRNYLGFGVLNLSTGAEDAKFIAAARVKAAAETSPNKPTPREMSDVHKRLMAESLAAFSKRYPDQIKMKGHAS